MKKTRSRNFLLKAVFAGFLSLITSGIYAQKKAQLAFNLASLLDPCNVTWDTPGPSSMQSMPIGNGDIGLNVWVEPNGDLCFLISKTDTWGAPSPTEKNNWIKDSGVLMKLGKVRVSVTPNPLAQGKPFIQTLKLRTGEILIKEGDLQLKVWVDANHPVIRVETQSTYPADVRVTLNNWRWGNGDVLAKDQANKITWYHQNPKDTYDAIKNTVFGATIKGKNLIAKNDTTLQSRASVKTQLISIYPLTTSNKTTDQWLAQMDKQAQQNDALNLELTRAAHQQWWDKFWHRSWVFINGDEATKKVNQGYIYSALSLPAQAGALILSNLTALYSWSIIRNSGLTQGSRPGPLMPITASGVASTGFRIPGICTGPV